MSRAALDAAVAAVRSRSGGRSPKLGIVIGSGLGAATGRISDVTRIPFGEIPGFPVSSVPGHEGALLLGKLGGKQVAVLSGRAHAYEGHGPEAMRLPLRALKALGCRAVILISAVGSLNRKIPPGRLALVSDHVNMTGYDPLTGPNDDSIGPRFPAMNAAYDPALRKLARGAAKNIKLKLAEGVTVFHAGPGFETPAEVRIYRRLGGDMVGMSMPPETVVARHCGLRVLGIGAVTNMAAGIGGAVPSHAETLKQGGAMSTNLARLLAALLEAWNDAV